MNMDATDRQHPYTHLHGCQSYLYLSQNLIFQTIRCLHRSFPPFLFSFNPNTGAPHTILLLSFPSSLPSSSFTALCFLHFTVQRRHTTAAGKREAEAKKRKERDEKMAQAKGKEQGEREDGDGRIRKKNEGGSVRREGGKEGRQVSDRSHLILFLSQAPRCFACKAITSIQLPGTLPVRSAFPPSLSLSSFSSHQVLLILFFHQATPASSPACVAFIAHSSELLVAVGWNVASFGRSE